jgi:hypothetical protein
VIIAGSAYPVFSNNQRDGHDLFSSEKPEAIREAQDTKRKEYRRQLLERRAKLQAEQEAIDQHQKQ